VIVSRLNLVTHLLNDELLRERVSVLLRRSHDSHRLLQKFAFGRGEADDLLALATTISVSQELVTIFVQDNNKTNCVQNLLDRIQLHGPSGLAVRIKEAIDEDGISEQHRIEEDEAEEVRALADAIVNSENLSDDQTGGRKPTLKKKPQGIREYYSDENEIWTMRPSASLTLQRLHKDLLNLHVEKQDLTHNLCERLGATSLTLRFVPSLGHICHVKGKDRLRDLGDTELKTISSSKSTRSFHHPEWINLGQRIDQCRIHIRSEEQRVFTGLREQVLLNIVNLRRNAAVLDELDVACSFATLAAEKGWTCPTLNQSSVHKVVGGRHPTVEVGLEEEGRTFVTNDCFVGDVQRSWLITGPNMAGKSTFLRQNALITLLAQVGSYVPAQHAEIGIVDRIFSRVGSADNLYKDQSTFMVEMLETAMILKNATSKSFVIMDEIGRGTTPTDGTAVAFACLHHLYHINNSRTLFATHFHALADMVVDDGMDGVGFYCTDVEEEGGDGGFRYIHKLRQGVNRNSHALKVAMLAGLPEEAIDVARRALRALEIEKGSI
jgi:DNA mismatch repair ATPase MutS